MNSRNQTGLSSPFAGLATRAEANQPINRTFCGMRVLDFISFSPKTRMPQNAGK